MQAAFIATRQLSLQSAKYPIRKKILANVIMSKSS